MTEATTILTRVDSVARDSPAFKAGLAPGMTVVAVAMEAYKEDRLAAAISANKDGQAPVDLLVRDGERFKAVRIDWRGGLRYPKLERVAGTADRLSAIYSAK